LIITLWLFQLLNKYSYRETLEKAKGEGFDVPSLCDYHYRVRQLDENLLKSILEECAKLLLEDKPSICYVAYATGFGDKYNLNRKRGTQIRTEQMFGSIKQKIGSSFNLLREDLARKASIACAILWNFWVLATSFTIDTLRGLVDF
jgi:hypothetical protein